MIGELVDIYSTNDKYVFLSISYCGTLPSTLTKVRAFPVILFAFASGSTVTFAYTFYHFVASLYGKYRSKTTSMRCKVSLLNSFKMLSAKICAYRPNVFADPGGVIWTITAPSKTLAVTWGRSNFVHHYALCISKSLPCFPFSASHILKLKGDLDDFRVGKLLNISISRLAGYVQGCKQLAILL